MLKLEAQIAKRYLKSKRKESFISFISWFALIGIALGVATLIIVMSVMNGFRKEIINNFIGTSGHIFVYSQTPNNQITNFQPIIDKLKDVEGVKGVFPSIAEQVLLSQKNQSSGVMLLGLSYDDVYKRELLNKSLRGYNLKEFKDGKNVVLLGKYVARNLGVGVGDNITAISPNGYSTMFGALPRFGSFKVIGIINTGMYQFDSSTAIIPFHLAQDFFFYGKNTQKIELFLDNPQNAESVKLKIMQTKQIYNLETWEDNNKYLINALEVERNVMFLILSLVILIAAFNIISGLVMLVRSKTKEIAILRAMGLSRRSIITIFLMVGIRIGFFGTFFGGLLGTLFSYNIESIRNFLESLLKVNLFSEEIYFLSKLPADINSMQVIVVIFMAILFSVLASIYPAIRASKIQPAEGLKYE